MSDPNAVIDSATAGAAAGWAWRRRDEIAESLAKLYSWFRGGKKNKAGTPDAHAAENEDGAILIIGSGGVGKTTLAKFLSGEYDLIHNPPGEYVESIETESFSFPGEDEADKLSARIVVPPGQEHRRPVEWVDLYRGISSGQFRGVILLNSYGYHSLGKIRYKSHHLFPQYRGKNKFLAAFLLDRRVEELNVLKLLLRAAPPMNRNFGAQL